MTTPGAARRLEEGVAALAAGQRGVVTRAQLLEAGLTAGAVRHRVRAGRLKVLHRGVYRMGPLEPPGAREMAAVLACGPDALVSHRSAARLQGMLPGPSAARGAGQRERPVDITVVAATRGSRPGIRVHRVRGLHPDERTELDGIPITRPERTLLDLARILGASALERAAARAERDRVVDRATLAELLVRHHGRAGVVALRAVLDLPAGPAFTRSEAEATFLALVRQAGLPAPRTNAPVGPFEADFLWRDARLVVEVDGFRHHGTRAAFEADRRKDAWLAAAGYRVVRLSWRQITDRPVATAVQVGQALAQAVAQRSL